MSHRPSSQYLDEFNVACHDGRLVYPLCASCGVTLDYAHRLCRCGAAGVHWLPVNGRGLVRAATVYHRAYSEGFQPPYGVIKLLLDEGVQLTAYIADAASMPAIGAVVRVALDHSGRLKVQQN